MSGCEGGFDGGGCDGSYDIGDSSYIYTVINTNTYTNNNRAERARRRALKADKEAQLDTIRATKKLEKDKRKRLKAEAKANAKMQRDIDRANAKKPTVVDINSNKTNIKANPDKTELHWISGGIAIVEKKPPKRRGNGTRSTCIIS
ncbi:hypothetical protein F-liban_293 [Faustovirus]|nr:hypothetical protein F-liban_293 [Faustovirus]